MSHFLTNRTAQIYPQKKKNFKIIAIWWPARAFPSNKLCKHTHSYALNAIPSNTKFSWFITTNTHPPSNTKFYFLIHYNGQRENPLSFLSLFLHHQPREKNPKIPSKKKKKPRKIQKNCGNSVIREDRTKNFNKFLPSLSHSFSPLLFLFRFQFSLHFLCSQTSTGAITEG